jgi:PAS domain S-box-containing protein
MIGEQCMAQQEAGSTHRQLFELLMQAPAMIALLRGPHHIYELANQLYMEQTGHRAILGLPIRTARPEMEGMGVFELLDQVYTTGQPFVGNEMRFAAHHPQTGQLIERYYNFVYQPVRDSQGEVDGVLIHGVEVTEQVYRRQKIQENEARLQRLVNSNVIGISFTHANGAIIDANERFLRMLGYTRDDVAAGRLDWTALTVPEYAARDREALQEIKRDGAVSQPYEKEYIDKDGNHVQVLVGGALLSADGEIATFVVDLRPQKQLENALQTAKGQLEAILQNAGDGITVHDVEGGLLYVNDVAAHMSGFASAEAMLAASRATYHQTLKRFVVTDEQGHVLKPEDFPGRRALREGRSIQQLVHYYDNVTEHSFWSSIKSQPIFNEEGEAYLVVNVVVDVSEQQALEQRKNEFISMASHELKTPVTSLKGFTAVLQRRLKKQGDEQGLHYLARMDAQLNKLTRLISDLLDISRMQTGKLELRAEPFTLDDLVEEVVENVQAATTTHRLSIEGSVRARVFGDQERLSQVYVNLLTNAIKYSPQGDTVLVRLWQDDEAQQALVSVQDFGIGIDGSHHDHIFERFYQVTDAKEQTYPGLGIGLYISSEIVARHQGRIWVESSKEQGSTFYVALPLCLPEEAGSPEG